MKIRKLVTALLLLLIASSALATTWSPKIVMWGTNLSFIGKCVVASPGQTPSPGSWYGECQGTFTGQKIKLGVTPTPSPSPTPCRPILSQSPIACVCTDGSTDTKCDKNCKACGEVTSNGVVIGGVKGSNDCAYYQIACISGNCPTPQAAVACPTPSPSPTATDTPTPVVLGPPTQTWTLQKTDTGWEWVPPGSVPVACACPNPNCICSVPLSQVSR